MDLIGGLVVTGAAVVTLTVGCVQAARTNRRHWYHGQRWWTS